MEAVCRALSLYSQVDSHLDSEANLKIKHEETNLKIALSS